LTQPNIVLILADDMGFSDVGCYGSEIETPNIDSMAREGVMFSQMYNMARCCPTRASLLTGLYPHNRTGTVRNLTRIFPAPVLPCPGQGVAGLKHETAPFGKSRTDRRKRNPQLIVPNENLERMTAHHDQIELGPPTPPMQGPRAPTRRRPLPAAIHPTKTDQFGDSAKRRARRTPYRAGNKLAPRQESFCAQCGKKPDPVQKPKGQLAPGNRSQSCPAAGVPSILHSSSNITSSM